MTNLADEEGPKTASSRPGDKTPDREKGGLATALIALLQDNLGVPPPTGLGHLRSTLSPTTSTS